MELTRKEFLILVAGGAAAAACGGSSESPHGNCEANGTQATISQNTGHQLVVSKEDVVAGVEKTYDIRGTDTTHTHSVTITAADFQSLQKNLQAVEISTPGGTGPHTHQITVACL